MTTNCSKKFFCDRCLNHFNATEKLEIHAKQCLSQNEYQIEMPTFENNVLQFRNFKKQLMVLYIIYADVESIFKKPDTQFSKSEKTVAYQQHEVCSIGYYFKCMSDDSQSYYKSTRGPNCVEWFVNELHGLAKKVDVVLNTPKSLQMSMEDEVLFGWADDCHICGYKFSVKTRKFEIIHI